jgi:uncharacterized protein
MPVPSPSPRTAVRRLPERAAYEREVIRAILDEGLVAHVGLAQEGQPFVLPMVYGCAGDQLYLHGSTASRLLRALAEGAPACATVTLLDGLVLARSAFHHSMNYRSVVVLGRARRVDDAEERLAALRAIVEHVIPGRWSHTRRPSAPELARTLVLALPLDEASAKLRTGPARDDHEDLALDHWAGEIPLRLAVATPVPDPQLRPGIAAPDHATRYARPGGDPTWR